MKYLLFFLIISDANTQLVNEDPENAKHDFAFDNPAFKGNKNQPNKKDERR